MWLVNKKKQIKPHEAKHENDQWIEFKDADDQIDKIFFGCWINLNKYFCFVLNNLSKKKNLFKQNEIGSLKSRWTLLTFV